MDDKCETCDEKGIHGISYKNFDTGVGWIGLYCNKCFVKKLRGMATAWSKK